MITCRPVFKLGVYTEIGKDFQFLLLMYVAKINKNNGTETIPFAYNTKMHIQVL